MNISYRFPKPIITLLMQSMVIIVAAVLWAPNAMAKPEYFTTGCAGCHGNAAIAAGLKTIVLDPIDGQTTCVSCHSHATTDSPPSPNSNTPVTMSAQPQQQIVKPGAALKVDITGGNIGFPRNGNVRLRLYDAAGALLSDGHGSLGAEKQPGVTIDATAPATIGQVNWQAAWLGNTLVPATANLVTTTWPVEPAAINTGHGEQRVDFSFYVCEDNDGDTFYSATCVAPGITLDCDDADATKTTVCPVNAPPTANAGADQTVAENSTVNLDGSLSTDAETAVLTFNWTIATKPANSAAVLSDATSATPSFVADAPGSYSIQLIVNDGTVDSAADTVTIVSNAKPTANAGNPQTAAVGGTVNLNGNGSSDPEADNLTFDWSIVAAPAGSIAAVSDSTSATPNFIPDVAGLYSVQLIVNDGLQNSSPNSVAITAELANIKPVANAGINRNVTQGTLVILDGSLSSDTDGPVTPLTYSWTVTSIPAGSTAVLSNPAVVMPTFTADLVGDYVFGLVVNDGMDPSDSSSVTITVGAGNAIPIANAGMDMAVFVNELVTLDGSGSTDADGDALTYNWEITSSPINSAAALSDATVVGPTFTPDLVGPYEITLIVNDGTVDSESNTVTITAGLVNTKPVANAGADQAVLEGAPAVLDGSGSSDANNDPLTYTWMIMASPEGSNAALSDSTVVMPSLTTDMPGAHVVALVVNDGTDDSEADTVTVMVGGQNTAPVANAGMSQTVVEGDNAMVDGSGSVDVDGNALTFSWSITSSPVNDPNPMLTNPDTATPTFPANVTGTYILQLIVNDGFVDSEPTTVTVMVGDGNIPPVANAGPDQAVFSDDTVALDGSASTDANGNPLTYSWTITSIPPGSVLPVLSDVTLVKPSFVATAIGDYITQLTVNDGKADSMVDTVIISVDAANVKPVSNAGPDQAGTVDVEFTLDGSGSSDADLDTLAFNWSFTKVPQGSETPLFSDPMAEMPSFVPNAIGEYVAQLIVNDGMEDSDADTVIINVEIGNTRPLADAGIDQTVMFNDAVTVDGSGSSDADNDVLTYLWTITTKPETSTISTNLVDLTTAQLAFQADVAGEYVFQLIVNDGTVDSLPDTMMVTVNPEVVVPPVEEPIVVPPVEDPEPVDQGEVAGEPEAGMIAALLTALVELLNMLMLIMAPLLALLQM